MATEEWNRERRAGRMRRTMDRLLEENFRSAARRADDGHVPVDLDETDSTFVIRASLPGIDPGSLQVTVQGPTISIQAQIGTAEQSAGSRPLMRERHTGVLRRSLDLPAAVKADQTHAQFENGVLTVIVPKETPSGPHRIRVSRRPASAAETVTAGLEGDVAAQGRTGADTPAGGEGPDMVTVESEESFPASDPPSWTPERA